MPVRAEIQGLRALAVALVVVHHLWPRALPGGFVGVDVFFAISGFLITAHPLREIERHVALLLRGAWTVWWRVRSPWVGAAATLDGAASSL